MLSSDITTAMWDTFNELTGANNRGAITTAKPARAVASEREAFELEDVEGKAADKKGDEDEEEEEKEEEEDTDRMQQPVKRQKSVQHQQKTPQAQDGPEDTAAPAAEENGQGRVLVRRKSLQTLKAKATIEAATTDAASTQYAGYSVSKTIAKDVRFTFYWLHKTTKTKPLMVSVGYDRRKSGHFTYKKAPGLPDSVPDLHCTSRPQVLAWILTHFSVANIQIYPRARKDLVPPPDISSEEAHVFAGLPPPPAETPRPQRMVRSRKAGKAAVPRKFSQQKRRKSQETEVTELSSQDDDYCDDDDDDDDSEGNEVYNELEEEGAQDAATTEALGLLLSPLSIPSPRLANLVDVPSPGDLLPIRPLYLPLDLPARLPARPPARLPARPPALAPPGPPGDDAGLATTMIPTDDESRPRSFRASPIPSLRPSEEPDMEIIEFMLVNCGACGLSTHQTPDCPLQATGTAPAVATQVGNIDTTFAITNELLHNIGCWSEVNSPEKPELFTPLAGSSPSLADAESEDSSPIPTAIPASWTAVLADPATSVTVVESVLHKLEHVRPSLDELAQSGIVSTVASLSARSPVKRVAEASRMLCHKWRTQAEQAMLELV